MRVTRRRLVTMLGSVAALAQTPEAPIPATPEDELKAVKEQNRRAAEALGRQKVPMATEPAAVFKA